MVSIGTGLQAYSTQIIIVIGEISIFNMMYSFYYKYIYNNNIVMMSKNSLLKLKSEII